jgi:hypothetical protein
VDLGLLYEFDVPQPWAGEHPWGQRTAERAVYRDNLEQIVLADKLGFEAVWKPFLSASATCSMQFL